MKFFLFLSAVILAVVIALNGCEPSGDSSDKPEKIIPEVRVRNKQVFVHVGSQYDPLSNIFVRQLNCTSEVSGFYGTEHEGDQKITVTVKSVTGDETFVEYTLTVADTEVNILNDQLIVEQGECIDLWDNVQTFGIDGKEDNSESEVICFREPGVFPVELEYDSKVVSYQVKVESAGKPEDTAVSEDGKENRKETVSKQPEKQESEDKTDEDDKKEEPVAEPEKQTCTPISRWVVDQPAYTEIIHHEKVSHYEPEYETVLVWYFNYSDGFSEVITGLTSQQAYQHSEEYCDEHDCTCQWRYEKEKIETGRREVIDQPEYDEQISHPEVGHYEEEGC